MARSAFGKEWRARFGESIVFDVFTRVLYGRLLKVLQIILADNGGRNLVKSHRGKLFSDPLELTCDENIV